MKLNPGYQERIRRAIAGPSFQMISKETPAQDTMADTSDEAATPRLARPLGLLGLVPAFIRNVTRFVVCFTGSGTRYSCQCWTGWRALSWRSQRWCV